MLEKKWQNVIVLLNYDYNSTKIKHEKRDYAVSVGAAWYAA